MKRFLTFLVCAAMILGLCTVMTTVTFAEDEKIYINETNFPDATFRNYLTETLLSSMLQYEGSNAYITKSDANTITTINVYELGVSSLEGIEFFPKLETLSASKNQLTSLDVSQNTKLKYLNCDRNYLTSLDVSALYLLRKLVCFENRLTSLDVTKNTYLTDLRCYYNTLSSLDVSNNTKLSYLWCSYCDLNSLDLTNNTALTNLRCHKNNLTTLDLSNNTLLQNLECDTNRLTSLDLSKNTALTAVECSANQLTTLTMSPSRVLEELWCKSNQLQSLDVSGYPSLRALQCGGNQLTSLDVSNNTALEELYCWANKLTSLDVSRNTGLTVLACQSNNIPTLDLSNNTALTDEMIFCSTQTITGSYTYRNGLYQVDLKEIVGSANTEKVTLATSGSYDPATGIATFSEQPTTITYNYDVEQASKLMAVTVTLSPAAVTGYTATLAAPAERYSGASEYFTAAGISVTGLTDGTTYSAGDRFTVTSEAACGVYISFDGGASYTELTATATADANTYEFTLPEISGEFTIGISLRGDANGDGKISAADALRIQRYATNDPDDPYGSNYEIDILALLAADVNGDGRVNAGDALRIQRYATNDPEDPFAEGTYEILW